MSNIIYIWQFFTYIIVIMLYEREQFFVISLYFLITITPGTHLIFQMGLLSLTFRVLIFSLPRLVNAQKLNLY